MMKPWGRFIIVIIAYGLALLHTAVPHQHVSDNTTNTTLSASGCTASGGVSGFLQSLFSADLGYGHLETFQKGTDADLKSSGILFTLIEILVPSPVASATSFSPEKNPYSFVEKLHKRLILSSTAHFRAPPQG